MQSSFQPWGIISTCTEFTPCTKQNCWADTHRMYCNCFRAQTKVGIFVGVWFLAVKRKLSEGSIGTELVQEELCHIAVITRKETRKVISDKDIWLGRLVEQRCRPNIPRTNLTAASRLTATAHAHLLLPRNSSLQKGEVRHLTRLSSEDIKE